MSKQIIQYGHGRYCPCSFCDIERKSHNKFTEPIRHAKQFRSGRYD